MAFGGGGGSGFTFGSNNNQQQQPQQQTSPFGGFGNNSTNTGFGATTNTGFGSSTAQSNPFGGNAFGSSTGGGFGSNANNTSSLFGSKPASTPFGASTSNTSGGLFGGSTNTSGGFGSSTTTPFGGTSNSNAFGSNNNNNTTTSSSFNFGNTNKPAFGTSASSGSLFGQGGAGTTGGFGSSTPFGGAGSGTALAQQGVPPSEGTAVVPFQPTNEKDPPGSTTTNSYQSITFMQPYSKYSFEELRLADYNAGRRFGNGSGQAGGFGSSTFGGFGSNTSGGFGSNNNTTTNANPFGTAATSSSGFGTNTATSGFGAGSGGVSGGLFGNKPASGGLFGQQSSGTTAGGLFGTSNTTNPTAASNLFGAGGSSGFASNTGTGLFGSNNQTQNKPSLFGTNTTGSGSSGFSFGNTANNASTGTSGGLFGSNNNTNAQTPGGFFGNNNQQQNKPLFGGSTGGGFGASSTQGQNSGGLFGGTNANNTSGGLFGNTQNSNAGSSGGLFGNSSTPGGGLFGNANNANTANKPGGLFTGSTFGNNPTQNNNTSSLFGNNNASAQQSSGGLFGSSNNNNNALGGFSFGNNNAQKPAGSLFGNNTNQSGGVFSNNNNSLFGNSQNSQQQNQQQQDSIKHASLLDPNPYGQSSIWTGLPVPTPENAKPLVTPLTATQKLKESQAKPLPSLRLNQSRYMTPPRRQGFGFSYSTYGTPNSAASTPGGAGLSNSMYSNRSFTGGSFGRSVGKSASISNLRSQYSDTDGVLTPGAFTPGVSRYSGGSIRRLTIDRSIRADLFSRPSLPALPVPNSASNGASNGARAPTEAVSETTHEPTGKLKKRVSFDKDATGGQSNGELNGDTGALVRTESDDETVGDPAEQSIKRGRSANGVSSSASEQIRGKELAVVPEDRESEHTVSKPRAAVDLQAKQDPKPGDYWMKPSRAEMSKMPRDKLQRFVNFEVGRQGCGKVVFNGAVDLTAVPLDDLYDKIVEIRLRSVTVYPDASSKPPMGKGLNVPSTISIENSWPRARNQPSSATSGPIFDKHINRLKKMHGTEFVNYEVSTGVWTFKVPHYTRYGLDYDDDDFSQSQISAPPDSIGQFKSADASEMEVDSDNYDDSAEDDTFAFKQKIVPGGFDRQSAIDFEPDTSIVRSVEQDEEGSDRSAHSEEDLSDNEMSMAGSFPAPNGPAIDFESPNKPILKSTRFGTPGKPLLDLDGDWAEQLQRTVSPRKQNRDALRDVQSKVLLDRAYEPLKPKTVNKKEFRTSIDVMNSLFSKHEDRRIRGGKAQAQPDFEFPFAKRAKTFDQSAQDMTDEDKAWHASFKPKFTGMNQLVYKSRNGVEVDDEWNGDALIESDNRIITLCSLKPQPQDLDVSSLLKHATVRLVDGVPAVEYLRLPFSMLKETIAPHQAGEAELYELLHVLFDTYEDEFSYDLSHEQRQEFEHRIRKDRLNKFLASLVWQRHADHIRAAERENAAAAALLHLTTKNVHAACDALMAAKDFHLMMLVSQIEQADEMFQQDIADQIMAWKEQSIISEMTEEIRALYELLAGNTTIAQGKPNGPVDDRATTFAISEKFALDWVQSFGLCLWYGQQKNGTVEEVIADFEEKLASREESASPVQPDGKEDPLWVILKLFASSRTKTVQAPVLPQALSALSKPWDCANIFRLHQAIITALYDSQFKVDREKMDQLSADLAFELDARGDFVGAAYALLHLSRPGIRAEMILDLLLRHASSLPTPPPSDVDPSTEQESSRVWTMLTTNLQIPPQWLSQAKALAARSQHDSFAELRYLLLAEELTEAHACLCRRVAPRLVIDEDWDALRQVVESFGPDVASKIGDWSQGGAVYADLVALMSKPGQGKTRASEKRAALERMQKSLVQMGARLQSAAAATGGSSGSARHLSASAGGIEELEERVAVKEMGRLVAQLLEQEGALKKAILELPLTADARLGLARTMGVDYYRGLMASAR